MRRLQRVARGDQQPNLIQPQPLQGQAGDVQVALVRRVERAAEDADSGAAPVTPVGDGVRMTADEGYQGRTWPVPVTT